MKQLNTFPRRNRTNRPLLLSVAALVTVLVMATSLEAQNAVTDWDAIALNTIVAVSKKNPQAASVYFAYVSAAMYDAVNSIDGSHTPLFTKSAVPNSTSKDAAAASAAHDVLTHYFPLQASTLDTALAASLGSIPDGPDKDQGIELGRSVAAELITRRASDGVEANITYVPGHGPGIWEPTPPAFPPPVAPWMAQMKPFTFDDASLFLSTITPPPALSSPWWAFNFNLTKLYGAKNSSTRGPEQTEIGLFWTDHPLVTYSSSFRKLAIDYHLNTGETARLFAMLYVASADSLIGCMNAKYHYAFWRPITAIQAGDTDGNNLTVADPAWQPLATTPGHPEYPAAHGCYTETIADILAAFFRNQTISYTVHSNVTGTDHTFTDFRDLVREVDAARIYGGMHYLHSVWQGNALGHAVADHVLRNYFLPVKPGED